MPRSGFYDVNRFINNLLFATSITQNTQEASVQSVAEASFDAWIKYYKRIENSDNNQVSSLIKA